MQERTAVGNALGERRYDLDWVRIGAFAALIFYHVGMYYVTWDWHAKSPHASAAIEPLMMLTSPWRLPLLFLVSGVATGYLLARSSSRGFLGQRSVRLLVPLLFAMAVIVPPQSYVEVVEKIAYPGSYWDFLKLYLTAYRGFCRGSDCLIVPTWNHLWFVAYLWVYTVLLYAGVKTAPRAVAWLRHRIEQTFGGAGIWGWPIGYLALVRVLLVTKFPANHALLGDWYNHALYLPVFCLGFALAGARRPWEEIERQRWFALGFAILGWAFLVAYFGFFGGDATPAEWLRESQRVVYGAEQWLGMMAVAGFARRHWNIDNGARRYLTTAIFPVYILHQTVIVVLAHALQPAQFDPVVEGILLILVTASVSLLGYEAVRRIRILRPLFGLARI